MQRREYQMACFGCSQRKANSFEIAQLADQNDIGVFA